MATILRPLSTGEVLDRTFFLYRKHFTLFVGIAAIPHLALLAVQLASAVGRNPVSPSGIAAGVGLALFSALVYLVVLAASTGATVVAVSQVHLDRPISVSEAYGAIKSRVFKLMLMMISVGIGVGIGFLLLIVPGVIFALMWSLTIPVAVIERKGLKDSTSRSAELTKGNRGRIFVVYFLFMVLIYIITLVWEVPLLAVMGLRHADAATMVNAMGTFQIVAAVCSFITNSLVSPLLTIALSLIYYDERVRKEAFDLELMMKSLDGGEYGATAVSSAM